jgi:hypothetical protein
MRILSLSQGFKFSSANREDKRNANLSYEIHCRHSHIHCEISALGLLMVSSYLFKMVVGLKFPLIIFIGESPPSPRRSL